MKRVAVIGAGQFGANHVRVVAQSPRAELAAIVDSDLERARAAAAAHGGCPVYARVEELPREIDAAIVAVPTVLHHAVGCRLLEAGVDVLIEKPIAPTLEQADELLQTAAWHERILQVGHLERFNPAVLAFEKAVTLPLFFEIHRLSVFSPRSLDVDVILDLMIHDLDILLSTVGSELEEIRASGISILSSRVDIANVRLQFRNGCVANLTASRVSTERVRKLRVFQPGQYLSVDYGRQDFLVISVDEQRQVGFHAAPVAKDEPLRLQFDAFLDSVESRQTPKVDGRTARRALEAALRIADKIEEHSQVVARTLARKCPE